MSGGQGGPCQLCPVAVAFPSPHAYSKGGHMANKIPSPWISASFFAWAILFALWQPFVWWRGVASVFAVALGFWGLYLWRRYRGKNSRTAPPKA